MKALHETIEGCVNCNICVKECAFLQKYGTPGAICKRYLSGERSVDSPVFECNLCSLCGEVCPKDLKVSAAFLEIRSAIQTESKPANAVSIHTRHTTICAYEKRGGSPLFALHQFPLKSDAVFFPGCTLAATRSGITQKTYEYIQKIEPGCGIILDCCAKPSDDLGLTDRFRTLFTKLVDRLKAGGVKKIYTACPSCYVTFKTHAPEFDTLTVYELLAANPPAQPVIVTEKVTVHDTCITRHESEIHDSVRSLIRSTGAEVSEVTHSREKTICCGEGGSAAFVAPEITDNWKSIRKEEAGRKRVITYCAGCSSTFGKELQTTHLLDLLFNRKKALKGREQQTKTPLTYLYRILLKIRLRK